MKMPVTRADQNLNDIVTNINSIKRFAIEVARGFNDDHLVAIETALRQAAEEIARKREIERRLR
jgi:hypothetical protein